MMESSDNVRFLLILGAISMVALMLSAHETRRQQEIEKKKRPKPNPSKPNLKLVRPCPTVQEWDKFRTEMNKRLNAEHPEEPPVA